MKRHDSLGQCFAISREPKISATAALIYSLQPTAYSLSVSSPQAL